MTPQNSSVLASSMSNKSRSLMKLQLMKQQVKINKNSFCYKIQQ